MRADELRQHLIHILDLHLLQSVMWRQLRNEVLDHLGLNPQLRHLLHDHLELLQNHHPLVPLRQSFAHFPQLPVQQPLPVLIFPRKSWVLAHHLEHGERLLRAVLRVQERAHPLQPLHCRAVLRDAIQNLAKKGVHQMSQRLSYGYRRSLIIEGHTLSSSPGCSQSRCCSPC